jgi:hypothetical protein
MMILQKRREVFDAMKAYLLFHQSDQQMFKEASAPSAMTQLQFTVAT